MATESRQGWLAAVVLLVTLVALLAAGVIVARSDTNGSGSIIAVIVAGVPIIITNIISMLNHRQLSDVQRKVNGDLDDRMYKASRAALGTGHTQRKTDPVDAPPTRTVARRKVKP